MADINKMLKIFLLAFLALSQGIRLKPGENDPVPPQPPQFNLK